MKCYHCGDSVIGKPVEYDEKNFCCTGCKSVYQILHENDLTNFYSYNEGSGVKPSDSADHRFKPLDVPEIFEDFITFQNDKIYNVTFFLPAIHCSSCIYLLENLQKLNPDILKSEANFTARTLQLSIKKGVLLSDVALLLDRIGYRPELRPNPNQKDASKYDKKLLLKLGIAGFAFGSVMLWTFPEYLGLDETFESFRNFTAYLSLLVAIPVFFYAAADYLKSAYIGIKTRQLNLDIPIAIGITVLFLKSSISVLLQDGPAYMDSFTGFVFFLLIGKWFQSKTYRNMAFDNDPKSYFPLGVHRYKGESSEEIVLIDKLEEGDTIKIYNEEIAPCDVELLSNKATINTSFITGESDLVQVKKGDRIYAGSKLIGSAIDATVVRTTDRSKFAGIWNSTNKEKPKSLALNRENKLSKYFLIIVFTVAAVGAITWAFIDPSQILDIVTAVLVVACPCALALSFPFVYGNALRKLGNSGCYFKNTYEIEKLNVIDHIIFDKTGTLTKDKTEGVVFSETLSQEHLDAVYALTKQSPHPYSKSIAQSLAGKVALGVSTSDFKEIPGEGIRAEIDGKTYKLGNSKFVNTTSSTSESGSYLAIDDQIIGKFTFKSQLRDDILTTLEKLSENYEISLLSGDSDQDAALLSPLSSKIDMHFNQQPGAKKAHVQNIEATGKRVLYIGDGLNDTEALNSATLGISVADDVFRFTPSCDAIIEGSSVKKLHQFLLFGKYVSHALIVCMVFSLLYNIAGMTFALMGYVTPLFAAILMPLSSISIVLLSTLLIRLKRLS